MTRKPAHVVRASPEAGKSQRRKPHAMPIREYTCGYFTEPVRADGRTWPPGWEPSAEPLKSANEYHLDEARAIAMQRRVGFAAGGGTIQIADGTRKRGRPRNHEGNY